jgi:hypothetical protein
MVVQARIAALRVLEGSSAPGALDSALAALRDDADEVAMAGAEMVRAFLRGRRGAEVTDALAAAALDRARSTAVRLAAIRALTDLGDATIAPLVNTLRSDPALAIRAACAAAATAAPAPNARQSLTSAADGTLPDDPDALRRVFTVAPPDLPLVTWQRIIDRVREREGAEPPNRRAAWTMARAAAHLVVARRGSRIALYDLRETLAATNTPLPVEFVAAVAEIGDATCLEPLATAYAKAAARQRDWWRNHLAAAFRGIAAREGITRRHGVMKRIERRWGRQRIDDLRSSDR